MHKNDFGPTAVSPLGEIHTVYSLRAQRLDKMLNVEDYVWHLSVCLNTVVYAAAATRRGVYCKTDALKLQTFGLGI